MKRLSSFLLGSVSKHLGQLNRKGIGSPPRLFMFSKTISVEKSYNNMQYYDSLSHSFQSIAFLNSNQHYARFSSLRNETEDENQTKMEVEIISKEFIKPTTPTPKHSRTYEVSLADQLFPNIYMSFVYFYPNTQKHDDLISTTKRRQVLLKQSLSQTLTKFYPLAGRIKDSRRIDCNDDGIYYVEAKVSDLNMSDFLKQPDNKSLHRLLPLDPNSEEELLSRNDLAMIQATTFSCGGISIGIYTSHKIIDAYSLATFFNAWATAAREAPDSESQINPIFISSSFSPSNPALPQDATIVFFPRVARSKVATRRFLFPASSLAALKQRAESSSRVLSVAALIWKCAVAANYNKGAPAPSNNSSTLSISVGLRDRTSPPAPPHSIGNVIFMTDPILNQSSTENHNNDDLRLDYIAKQLKIRANKFTSEFLKKMRENWILNAEATLNGMKMWYNSSTNKEAKHMMISSTCRSGTYELADFGWGKPIWVCVGNGDSKLQYCENLGILMDTKCGNGIEAWVTLCEEDMRIFEQDAELLAFATMNANPLEKKC